MRNLLNALFGVNRFEGYALNWKPSPPDARDKRFSMTLPKKQAAPPPSADVSASIPEVYDQGQIGSCTGNSSAMLGLHQSRLQNREISPSRLMLYYGAREIEGFQNEDSGAYIRDIFKAWAKDGVCPESVWRYDESKVLVKPSHAAYDAGKATLVTAYHTLDNTSLNELKTCLAMGHPFVFGFNVHSSFMYGSWASLMPMPKYGESILGGHAVCAVGYDDAKQAFRIKNSWGTDWKQGGYFWMPYEFITSTKHCDDFWMIEGVTPANEPHPTPSNITSIVDLKHVFKTQASIKCICKEQIVLIGKEMGLNTDTSKSKAQNAAIVAGGLGL